MSGRTLELTRSQRDRQLYELDGVGTLRLEGLGSGRAKAAAGAESWTFSRRFWKRLVEATDGTGATVGEFEPRLLRRGGAVRWRDRELLLRPASQWRERYALVEGDRELVLFDGKSWGKRPVRVTVEDPDSLEPGLLLFVAFVVRGLARDDGSSSSAATTATAGGG